MTDENTPGDTWSGCGVPIHLSSLDHHSCEEVAKLRRDLVRLHRFHEDVVAAFDKARQVATVKRPGEKTLRHTFLAGQRLRRLVREAIERFDEGAP